MTASVYRAFLFVVTCALSARAAVAPPAEHVFIISIDGGKPAVIQRSAMPVLQKLVAEGAHTWTATTIFPSITLPSHTSMLTGVGPDKHKILWNTWMPALGVVKVPTVFAGAKQAGYSTAMFVGKEKFRHLAQPDTLDRFDFDGTKPGATDNPGPVSAALTPQGTVPAKTVAQHAALYILEQRPALCFIHFTDPDDAGHQYGWGSPEQVRAFAEVDAALGVVIGALHAAGIDGQSVVIVTADHGGHDRTHGLNIPDDMNIPWIAWGKGVRKGFEITAPVNTCDTAATALWLLGVPEPAGLDGRSVTSAFEATFHSSR